MEKFYKFNHTDDQRTSGAFVGVKPFFGDTDTKIPSREIVVKTWIDRLLRRQRMRTVWVSKRTVRIRLMMRKTINCRCAMVKP